MGMLEVILEIEDIHKSYPGVEALAGVSFKVGKGQIHGFLGPNGAGKSTTLNIITGLLQANRGRVLVKGSPLDVTSHTLRSRVGYLPEKPPVYRDMSVVDYLSFVGKINSVDYKLNQVNLKRVMEQCGLVEVKSRLIGNLSKGYTQRVGIAQALVHDPEIVILDEPTSGLDPLAISEIRDLIKDLSQNHTILFSSHQLYEVELLCSEVTIIHNGKILCSGDLQNILSQQTITQKVNAHVLNWDEDKLKKLKATFDLISVHHKKNEKSYLIELELSCREDVRGELSQFFVVEGCNLISLESIENDLESIFKKLTGKENV